MVIVEVRPGYTVQMTEEEAKKRGYKPFEPRGNKKSVPTNKKKAKRAAQVENVEDSDNGIRNDS